MKKTPPPAFQFYPHEWSGDPNVIAMSAEEEGHYIKLVGICWTEGYIPADQEEVQLLLKSRCETLERILKCFYINPKNNKQFLHKRLELERKKQKAWKKKCAKGGAKTQRNKKLNSGKGSSTLLASKRQVKAKSLVFDSDSDSDSISNSKSKDKTHVPEKQVLEYLNEKAGKNYKPVKSNLDYIRGRLADGFTLEDCMTVVDNMVPRWKGDPKMDQYLRPATLFAPRKFDGYRNTTGPPAGRTQTQNERNLEVIFKSKEPKTNEPVILRPVPKRLGDP